MNKILRILSKLIVVLVLFSAFGAIVRFVDSKTTNQNILDKVILKYTDFPITVKDVFLQLVNNIPPTYIERDTINLLNSVDDDLFLLESYYTPSNDVWKVCLNNVKHDSTLHTWFVDRSMFYSTNRLFENSELRSSILLDDRHLIVSCDETNNLMRLDQDSKVIWKNSSHTFHHSLELGPEGNLWGSTKQRACFKAADGVTYSYRDDYVINVDVNTGEVLSHISLSDIFLSNGYNNFIFGSGNTLKSVKDDPLHLNDVEPVLFDGSYWKKGDLFLSLRHKSLIFLYRPSNHKIISVLSGPFLNQHDVDVVDDHTISFFNNNAVLMGKPERNTDAEVTKVFSHSCIMEYDFQDSTYSKPNEHIFKQELIYTQTQGLLQNLSKGRVYFESQNNGKVYIVGPEGIELRKYIETEIEGYVSRPHWSRVYEKDDLPLCY